MKVEARWNGIMLIKTKNISADSSRDFRREVKNETISAYTSLEVFILRNLKKKKKKVSPDKSLLFRFKVMK
ncbi:hypothetical protein Avbf_04315 [Armadillidium vulgare]|nr:hypothetical protein Avbf_04315 [Armadillidium vulgare]